MILSRSGIRSAVIGEDQRGLSMEALRQTIATSPPCEVYIEIRTAELEEALKSARETRAYGQHVSMPY